MPVFGKGIHVRAFRFCLLFNAVRYLVLPDRRKSIIFKKNISRIYRLLLEKLGGSLFILAKLGLSVSGRENRGKHAITGKQEDPLGDGACCQKKLEKVKFCNDGT